MNYDTIQVHKNREVSTIRLNRPEKRNAISTRMIEELLTALDEIERHSRVLIITAAGKAFCSGMDLEGLRELATQSPEENLQDSRRIAQLFHRIYSFPRPVISAVNGAAIAGGCGIATMADFTLAVPEASFGYTEVRIGFIPAIISVFLRRQIGAKQTRDLLLSGRIFDAAEALRLGLVTETVSAEKLSARAEEIADTLLRASPASIAHTKKTLLSYDSESLEAELDLAVRENAEIRSTPDFQEGLSAFLEKREPKWAM